MTNFKKGDKVICVDNKDYEELTIGKIYVVLEASCNYPPLCNLITIEVDNGKIYGANIGRFKPFTGFKVGDRVKVVSNSCNSCCSIRYTPIKCPFLNAISRIVGIKNDGKVILSTVPIGNIGGCSCSVGFGEKDLLLMDYVKEDKMSEYADIKNRIENLTGNSPLKETDDILREMFPYNDLIRYRLSIPTWHEKISSIWIIDSAKAVKKRFIYDSQCEKMAAFKKALLWLLDHSELVKENDKKNKEIEDIRNQINQLQDRLIKLER